MTHISEESTFETVRFFRPVFCHPQVFFGFQQFIPQTLGTEILEERDTQAQHQNDK